MTDRVDQQICITFCVKLEHSSTEIMWWFRRPHWRATGDWQFHHSNTPAHASRLMQSFFGQTSNHSGNSVPLQFRFGTLQLLAFPKLKSPLKGRDFRWQWDSGKYDGAADGDWENCVRSQGAYFEGNWGIIILSKMFLVSSVFFTKCLYFHITWLDWKPSVQTINIYYFLVINWMRSL